MRVTIRKDINGLGVSYELQAFIFQREMKWGPIIAEMICIKMPNTEIVGKVTKTIN